LVEEIFTLNASKNSIKKKTSREQCYKQFTRVLEKFSNC